MSSDDLNDYYKKLTESLSLPADAVNELAELLLQAPASAFITKKMRIEAIVMHPNHSRETYELLVRCFEPETFQDEDTMILHMLLTYPNAAEKEIQALHDYAEQHGASEWFKNTVKKTIELNEYQLGLTYNGASLFQDSDLREQLMHTNQLLKGFQD